MCDQKKCIHNQKYEHDKEDKEFIDKLKKTLKERLSIRVNFDGENNYGHISNTITVQLLLDDEVISGDTGYIDLVTESL